MTFGTSIKANVVRVVDGDTLRVKIEGQEQEESLRILCLDTEESQGSGNKPVTPWGKKAKEHAESLFKPNDEVTLEFPGNDPVEVALKRYRGNFGRLLVFVHKGNMDFQEHMIQEGYSPYFDKYGNAAFPGHHERYVQAERTAQKQKKGVWNQLEVNGSEMRNYAALGTWWDLRARLVDEYRALRPTKKNLFNSRLDYDTLKEKAKTNDVVTVFTELRSLQKVAESKAIIRIGSLHQPFSLFLPDTNGSQGQEIVNLLETRYFSASDSYPRRNYAYITGPLSLFNETPQIILSSETQITETLK